MNSNFLKLKEIKNCFTCGSKLRDFKHSSYIGCPINSLDYVLAYSLPNCDFWGLTVRLAHSTIIIYFNYEDMIGKIWINGQVQKFTIPLESLFDGSFKKKINMFGLLI